MPAICMNTPVGPITIREKEGAITHLTWPSSKEDNPTTLLKEAVRQLQAYFDRKLQEFDLPLAPRGNEFQIKIYDAMRAIPYGQTRTYGEIAKELGTYGQPVGQACGSNPIPIIIPCHRVLSANGLGGFSATGGVEDKIVLLKHEDAFPFLL